MHRLTPLLLSSLMLISSRMDVRAGLVFERGHLDIAAVVTATQTEAVFPFHVEEDRPVFITGIKSSCECTEGRSERKAYQPGEKGEIRAIFKHGERVGEQFKSITVRTDEQGVGPQRLSFKVVIPRVVEVTPVALFWEAGGTGQAKEIQIVFPDDKFPPVEVVIVGERKNVDAGLRCVEQGKKYVLTVTPHSTSEPWKEELPIEINFGGELGVRRQICYAYAK